MYTINISTFLLLHSPWNRNDIFCKLLQVIFGFYSFSHFIPCWCSVRIVLQIDYIGNRKPLCCSCRWWKFWLTGAWLWLLSRVLKGSVGDWRWSLDNIRWPFRAVETISLHGATLLLLSCLDTSFFLLLSPSLLSPCLLLSVSVEWSFCELAACIWSWSNLLVEIRKWCAQSFVIVLSDRAIWGP